MRIDKKYLVLPVGYHAASKNLRFYHKGELVFDLHVCYDNISPDTYFYFPLDAYMGMDIDFVFEPEIDATLTLTDEKPSCTYSEKYRPQAHFTMQNGWINDPNGLVFYNGEYHLFCQHNPVGSRWGNMSWGHAKSSDLFHWEELPEALLPDETGTMFSGSAITDTENVSGLSDGTQPAILLFYTAAGGNGNNTLSNGRKFTQCMAYSTDGGKTFTKYQNNPILSHIEAENRDPKVIYCEELKKYLMALYLVDNRYLLLTSDNLIDWKRLQEINLAGDAECPDIYPLNIDGDPKKRRWILSGASDRYIVGMFKNGKFHPENLPKRLHYGRNSYAAQTFSGVADGRRIRIAWNTMEAPAMPFNCSMCVPCDMTLTEYEGEPCLCSYPVPEIVSIHEITTAEKIMLTDTPFVAATLSDKAQDISLTAAIKPSSSLTIKLYGIEIACNADTNEVSCCGMSMPLYHDDGCFELRILADTLGLEIFAGHGKAHMCVGHLCDYTLNRLVLSSDKPQSTIELSVSALENIWR